MLVWTNDSYVLFICGPFLQPVQMGAYCVEVKEKDFAGKSLGAVGRDDTTGKPIYAEEILVTRTDIEEQAAAMREMQVKLMNCTFIVVSVV